MTEVQELTRETLFVALLLVVAVKDRICRCCMAAACKLPMEFSPALLRIPARPSDVPVAAFVAE